MLLPKVRTSLAAEVAAAGGLQVEDQAVAVVPVVEAVLVVALPT